MKSLQSEDIFGNWATILLPINEDESIDYEKLSDQIDRLIHFKINGIYSNGTAAEFYNQTEYEFDKINEMLAGKCNDAGMPFQIGCSHMSPRVSLDRIKRIRQLKPGAVQLILPDWYPPSRAEVIDYLKSLSDVLAPVGIVLYNPGHAKIKLLPEDFEIFFNEHVNIVGCKMTGGDDEWYKKMSVYNSKLSVFIPGHKLVSGINAGAKGSYSNVACINPVSAQNWYNMIIENMSGAFELQKRMQEFIYKHIVPFITKEGYSDPAVDKFMAALGGWGDITPRLRWPYRSIPFDQVITVRDKCKALLPEFF